MPRFCLLLLLLACVFVWARESQAHSIDATSRVSAVTVFGDRALVTRTVSAHIVAGAHGITVTDMPAGLNESTLRVQGKANGNVKIGTIEVKHIFLTEQANTAEHDKTIAIEARNDQKALLQGEIKALEARETFIERIVDHGAEKTDATNTKLDFAPEKWAQAWGLVQSGMGETQKDLATKRIAMRKLDEDITKLQQELNQVRTSQPKERREAHIAYEASADTDIDLTLTYQTAGATWQPVYDARLDTAKGSLDLEQYGQVTQVTGEDWSDIDLTLSTARPAAGSEMPRISEWWVQLLQPVQNMLGGVIAKASNGMARAPIAAAPMMLEAVASDAAKQDIEPVQATVFSTEYAAEFHVPGHVALKSVNDTTKLFIGSVSMKAVLVAQTSPRLVPTAYLFAKITNGETYPLIPGSVAKYRDGAFIGNAALPLLRSGDNANLSFGIDDRVKVTYLPIKRSQDNPTLVVIGDMTVERQYQTKVQNLHKDPMTITVFESYPVANDPDVSVKLLEDVTTQGFEKDPDQRQGVIIWSGVYAPKEEKNFTLGFRVKYPKDRQIMGL